MSELIAPDAVIEWPVSAERFTSRDSYVTMNREYPEGWEIRILRVIGSADGKEAVSEVEVPHPEIGLWRAVSLWTVADGQITSGTEYWTSPGSAEPRPDRATHAERM